MPTLDRRSPEPRLSIIHEDENGTPHLSAGITSALGLLLQANDYAAELGYAPWEFAVEIGSFNAAGITNSDLRWLVCQQLAKHAMEVAPGRRRQREFRTRDSLAFCNRSCFIASETGIALARDLGCEVMPPASQWDASAAVPPSAAPIPTWDDRRREFALGGRVIKKFRGPAANQETILAAFQEDGWPAHIDDPLPPHPAIDSKRRLHDTINSLNRHQAQNLIHFIGDGRGQGVCWEVVPTDSPANHQITRVTG